MNKIRITARRYICFLLCLCFLFALAPVSALAEEPQTKKVVRVGWYEDSYNITGAHGERSGYGYEYEQSVAAYTGWTYEYVKAGWSDLLEMMENGEIDLMGGISYTDERAESMLFSELPMGREKYYLYADLKHTDISASDLTTLNGKRVALMKGSVHATQFYEWEEAHNLHLQYVWANSFEQGQQQARDREIDCVISTETPAWVEFGMSAIATVGGSDIYFAINKNRPDLKEELDSAMRKMEYDKPFYADELYQRYLSAVSVPVLSSEEQAWLDEHGKLRVGFLTQDAGISSFDPESGELTGVLIDYIHLASDCLSDQTLDFDIVGFDSIEDEIQALKDRKIDLIFHFTQNPYVAEQNGFVLSNTVLTYNMAAITTQNYFNETAENSVAIPKDDLLVKWYVSYHYPEWNIIEYDSPADAEKAVCDGQADCLLAQADELSNYTENKKLHSVFLTQPGNTAFAVNLGDSILLSILNKTLRTIPTSMLTGALSMYETALQKVTVTDFIRDNLAVVATLFTSIFVLILLLVLGFLHKSRAAETKARQAADRAQDLNKKLQESQHELEAALQTAEAANKAKSDFLSNMSHDIRTPMNAIVGITKLMQNEEGTSDKLHTYIQKVQLSSQHLLSLINDVLDMSKIESSEVALSREPVSLAEQIGQVDSIIRPQAEERGQEFTILVHRVAHEYLIGDSVRLRQVFINLLSNAVKYTPYGGKIQLDLTELPCSIANNASFRISVIDNGCGMSPEFLQRIFEPFTRAESSVTNRVQGTGLGMAITKNIVDLMGGAITVESELNKGSRFDVTLTFPIDQTRHPSIDIARLLLVSDDEVLINNMGAALQEAAVPFSVASTEQEAETILQSQKVEVILLAGHLHDQTLGETVRLLRGAAKDAVLIFCCDYAQQEQVHDILLESGVDGLIARPFFLSNLIHVIEHITGSTSPETEENAAALNGMKFLCAEDNELNAEILQALLEMNGASCTIYPNGKELTDAFAAVKPGDYDMILMDVMMPVMDGLEATRLIRSGSNPLGRTISIVAMTANAFAEDIQKSREAGMDEHLSKPLNIDALKQVVRRFRVTPPR